MKITLVSEDAIRLEPTTGPMTVEAHSAYQPYSPFHNAEPLAHNRDIGSMTDPVVRFTVKGEDVAENAPTHGSRGRPYTVVYDGYCKVCKRLVAGLIKWDKHNELEILPSQTPGLAARYPWIPAKAYLESVQFIENRNGTTWQGAAALEHIIDVLPKGRLITWIFSIPVVRPLAEKFYRWFAKNRYRLGCGEHCQLHQAELQFPE